MRRLLFFLSMVFMVIFVFFTPNVFQDNVTILLVHNIDRNAYGAAFFYDNKNIITASHIIEPEGAIPRIGRIEILDEEGRWHSAKVLGIDTDSDIAVLNIDDGSEIKHKRVCSRDLGIEDFYSRKVFYSKNYGYSPSGFLPEVYKSGYPNILAGEVLGPDLQTGSPRGVLYIIHDSAVIPGFSGSPLLDENDCYIGMNINVEIDKPKVSRAVATMTIERVVPDLIAHGRVDMPFLGILFEQTINRVFVSGVAKDSPSDFLSDFGVKRIDFFDDVAAVNSYPTHEVFDINGNKISRIEDVWRALRSVRSSSIVNLIIKDASGNAITVTIPSGERYTMIRKIVPRFRFLQNTRILIG